MGESKRKQTCPSLQVKAELGTGVKLLNAHRLQLTIDRLNPFAVERQVVAGSRSTDTGIPSAVQIKCKRQPKNFSRLAAQQPQKALPRIFRQRRARARLHTGSGLRSIRNTVPCVKTSPKTVTKPYSQLLNRLASVMGSALGVLVFLRPC